MMYNNNFVVVIKHRGKVLRESNNGIVRLPFGSDYTILLKNKDSRKAVADVEIDGEDVATGIIVPGNESVELKGALNGLKVRNHFRFIKKTKEISDFRGDRPDDGLVRVEYRFEQPEVITIDPPRIRPMKKRSSDWSDVTWTYYDSNTTYNFTCDNSVHAYNCSDAGITVPGAETKQNFSYGHTRPLEAQSHVIVLQLKGTVRRKKKVRRVKKAITVRSKIQCQTCGRKHKSHLKFCGNCGTYLK
jgi:ribosomal protein L32